MEQTEEYSFNDIAKYFELPLADAARMLNISVSKLKTTCREKNIPRWPFRRVILLFK
jgi:hypothetical protein